jgi:hypothetical protein
MPLRPAYRDVFDREAASRVVDPSLSVLILSCAWGTIDLGSSGPTSIRCSRPDLLQRYRFATGTAEFLLCRECGVYLGAQVSSDGARFGILNTLALNPIPSDLRSPEAMNYGGETAESRRVRRATRWTPLMRESI